MLRKALGYTILGVLYAPAVVIAAPFVAVHLAEEFAGWLIDGETPTARRDRQWSLFTQSLYGGKDAPH